jgi:hypothetical protein
MAAGEELRLIHAVPGRVRLHVADWPAWGERGIEARLHRVRGVRSARASRLTGNILVLFDPEATDERAIVDAERAILAGTFVPAGPGVRKGALLPPFRLGASVLPSLRPVATRAGRGVLHYGWPVAWWMTRVTVQGLVLRRVSRMVARRVPGLGPRTLASGRARLALRAGVALAGLPRRRSGPR